MKIVREMEGVNEGRGEKETKLEWAREGRLVLEGFERDGVEEWECELVKSGERRIG